MQFGVCGGPEMARAAARAGYDFVETSVGELLKPREPRAAFRAALDALRAGGLPCPALNRFIPRDLKIIGPAADRSALGEYVAVACERAQEAGVDTIVFGSGEARQVPDGVAERVAHEQLAAFCSMAAAVAANHGVTIVVEPLNRAECNVLNRVSECAALVREVAHPALRLLVDAYHLMKDGDAYSDIVVHRGLLRHVHIATTARRVAPGAEPCDFGPFFGSLVRAGYDRRVSVEAGIADPPTELPIALSLMRRLLAEESARP